MATRKRKDYGRVRWPAGLVTYVSHHDQARVDAAAAHAGLSRTSWLRGVVLAALRATTTTTEGA